MLEFLLSAAHAWITVPSGHYAYKYFSLGHKPSKFDSSSTPRLGFFCGGEEHNSICSIPDTIAASIGPLVTVSFVVCFM